MWDFLEKEDIYEGVLDFFPHGKLLMPINITQVLLIPKTSNVTQLKDFRPISCF